MGILALQLSGDLQTDMTETIGCWSNVVLYIFIFYLVIKTDFIWSGNRLARRYEFSGLHYKLMWPFWIMTWKQTLLGRSSENYNSETENWYWSIFPLSLISAFLLDLDRWLDL